MPQKSGVSSSRQFRARAPAARAVTTCGVVTALTPWSAGHTGRAGRRAFPHPSRGRLGLAPSSSQRRPSRTPPHHHAAGRSLHPLTLSARAGAALHLTA
jgi:hypothetical protein